MVKRSSKCLEEVWERNFDNNGGGACGKGAPLNGCISKEIYLDKKEGTSFSILWFSPFFYVPCRALSLPSDHLEVIIETQSQLPSPTITYRFTHSLSWLIEFLRGSATLRNLQIFHFGKHTQADTLSFRQKQNNCITSKTSSIITDSSSYRKFISG